MKVFPEQRIWFYDSFSHNHNILISFHSKCTLKLVKLFFQIWKSFSFNEGEISERLILITKNGKNTQWITADFTTTLLTEKTPWLIFNLLLRIFKRLLFTWKAGLQWEERGRDRNCPPTGTFPKWPQRVRRGPRAPSRFPTWVQGSKHRAHFLLLSQVQQGLEPGLKSVPTWNVHMAGKELICNATMPALLGFLKTSRPWKVFSHPGLLRNRSCSSWAFPPGSGRHRGPGKRPVRNVVSVVCLDYDLKQRITQLLFPILLSYSHWSDFSFKTIGWEVPAEQFFGNCMESKPITYVTDLWRRNAHRIMFAGACTCAASRISPSCCCV